LARFRQWTASGSFPGRGRIDYLRGTVEVDLSPEDLYTHGVVKTAIASELHQLIAKAGRGNVFVGRTRVVSPAAGLSVEPDVVVVLWDSLREGRIREVPAANAKEGRFSELEGAPDLVVEIVSDTSASRGKRLPRLYSAAGIPELWLVDARGPKMLFEIWTLWPRGYERQARLAEGGLRSPLLQRAVRLTRKRNELSRWQYEVEIAAYPGS
jgi:Uma2 family endonuclease